jgi:hypothetical protein
MNIDRAKAPALAGGIIVLLLMLLVLGLMLIGQNDSNQSGENSEPAAVTDTQAEYRAELEEEMRMALGAPVEAFDPDMLMEIFPGLEPADFDGVEYVGGTLSNENETLQYQHEENSTATPSPFVTEAGFKTLVANVAARTAGEQTVEATVGVLQVEGYQGANPRDNLVDREEIPPHQIMDGTNPSVIIGDQIGCPEDAQQCSDGSWVGRTGPDCEFVCPDASDPSEPEPVACTMDAKECPDGSYVGRVGPNCEFAECPRDVTSSPITMQCPTNTMYGADCPMYDDPVCGLVEVQCVTEPCDPQPTTFSNDCVACQNQNLLSYTAGACEDVETSIDYGMDASKLEEYRTDCEAQGGVFDECGSACEPGAEICMDVCVMKCLFIQPM